MALALVKLSKKRGKRVFEFLDYISADVAKINVEIQGAEHSFDEWSKVKIIKIFDIKK